MLAKHERGNNALKRSPSELVLRIVRSNAFFVTTGADVPAEAAGQEWIRANTERRQGSEQERLQQGRGRVEIGIGEQMSQRRAVDGRDEDLLEEVGEDQRLRVDDFTCR